MAKKLLWVLMALLLFAPVPQTFGMSGVIWVTKESQEQKGLKYTLVATRVSDKAVLVTIEIPKKGKLAKLEFVRMTVGTGSGSPLVSAELQTKPNKNGDLVATFQLSPELAEKCSVDMGPTLESYPRNTSFYAVQLKGYITVRK